MANPEHLTILEQGADAWIHWRYENPDVVADLSKVTFIDANLSGLEFTQASLRHANFIRCDLASTTFGKSNLNNVSMTESNLTGTDFSYSNMQSAILKKSNLTRARFFATDLGGSNLSECILAFSYFRDAQLRAVNFSYANLTRANMNSANLSYSYLAGAILNECDLSEVNLTHTNLAQADFENANLSATQFNDVDLSQARNLDKAIVRGPCSIGIDTIYKSGGNIPEAFLRACGVQDEIIEYSLSLRGAILYHKAFISYSHQDMIFARRLHDTLQGRNIRCWRDEEEIKPGKIIREEVSKGIHYHEKLLLLCSRHSLNSPAVEEEIAHIFDKEDSERKQTGKLTLHLIPIDLDGYLLSPECHSRFKPRLKERLVARFEGWEKDNSVFEREIEKVIWALEVEQGE